MGVVNSGSGQQACAVIRVLLTVQEVIWVSWSRGSDGGGKVCGQLSTGIKRYLYRVEHTVCLGKQKHIERAMENMAIY